MGPKLFVAVIAMVAVAGMLYPEPRLLRAGQETLASGYKVLEPIRNGSLTVFPVVASKSYATGEFLTLDEGLRSGEVVVTEYGNVRGLVRRVAPAPQRDSAEVNRLVLVNNSKRPLLLLAGEIVAGGKQDRVIGMDRIVPSESDPIDLNVFCVEPGRWVATSDHFGSSGATYGSVGGRGTGTAVHGGRSSGSISFGTDGSGITLHKFLRRGDGEPRREAKSGGGGQADRAELSESYQATTRSQRSRSSGGGERARHLVRCFREHGIAGKILAEAGALVCIRSGCDARERRRGDLGPGRVVPGKYARPQGDDRERARSLSSHRDQRRRLQGVRVDVAVAEDGI